MKLRFILFAAFAGTALLPVAALAGWSIFTAMDKEMEDVRDKHLVIARNVGEALERYSVDLKNAFDLVAGLQGRARNEPLLVEFLNSLDFVHFCIANLRTGVVETCVAPDSQACPARIPPDRLAAFTALLQPGETVFTPVMRNLNGDPSIYMLRATGDRLFIGAVGTGYIVKQGRAVAFGAKGHAAIVDATGQVIAHPLADWRKSIRNIAQVPPVRRMMQRETGVTSFFSPALQADMVTGFTYVPTTGWGVMIPQPLAEIRAEADAVQYRAAGTGLLGVLIAGLLSWYLSGYLARPLSSVARTARRMAGGDLSARASFENGFQPREVRDLREAFNGMAAEIGKANGAMAAAVAEANRANQAKSEFLACMSHDLRTPLNAIVGIADAMRSKALGPLDDDRRDSYLGDIQRSGNMLLVLINDILDLSKIESGSYDLMEADIDIGTALQDAADLSDYMARQHGVGLTLSLADDLPLLRCDRRSLAQVLNNLLSNAIKFSHRGGEVRIGARIGPAGGLEIAFGDDGIGMMPEEMDRLKQPFTQAASHTSRVYQGTGLGLYICLKIMELHGGTLELDSRFGRGTTVTARFPAARSIARGQPPGAGTGGA
ncbi:MAG: sensor histidine kinase [Sneathiellaceae bacterium]